MKEFEVAAGKTADLWLGVNVTGKVHYTLRTKRRKQQDADVVDHVASGQREAPGNASRQWQHRYSEQGKMAWVAARAWLSLPRPWDYDQPSYSALRKRKQMSAENAIAKAEPLGSGTGKLFGTLLMMVVGAVLAGFGTYLFDEYIKPKPLYVNIQVFDDSTPPNALKDVAVWLGLKDVDPKHTGDFGVVRFEVARKHRKEVVTPKLQLQGYSPINGQNTDKLVLDRGETNAIFIFKKDVSPDRSPVFERTPYSSGSKASGPGAAFSEWYQLCNDPAPEGWTIAESSFSLTGDRQCNSWSECKQTVNDPQRVCWQFRMQGHSEQVGGLFNQGNTGIQLSTGVLSVLWKH